MICINQKRLPKNGNVASARTAVSQEGLREEEAVASRRQWGSNRLSRQKRRGFWSHFLSNLNDPVIRILLAALALNLLLMFRKSDWVETLGIAVSVLLATTISTVSEVGSEAAFDRLRTESEQAVCRVRRDGRVREIHWDEVVVGDAVLLSPGENIPADGSLIAGEIRVDQAAMTGESREVRKTALVSSASPSSPRSADDPTSVYRGCAVLSGEGIFRVEAVGDRTVLGGISREVQEETRESPLKLRLARLAGQISLLGYLAAILVAAVYLFGTFVLDSGFRWELVRLKLCDLPFVGESLLHALMLGLTVIVVAVPEGLPMMIAVVLSANIRRMIRDQVMVRKPAGIEAAGSMDLLFTDKTGTLTQGKLQVGGLIGGDGTEYRNVSDFAADGKGRMDWYRLCCCYNTLSVIGSDAGGRSRAIGGNSTDRALTSSVLSLPVPQARLLHRLGFDSARKYAGAAVDAETGSIRGPVTLLKGAPERLLPFIRDAVGQDGTSVPWNRPRLESLLRRHTAAGERVLVLAVSDRALTPEAMARGEFGPLSFLCAVILADHLRPEAPEAVAALHRAGIQVVMITGDSRDTAAQIAKKCGILSEACPLILTGEELAAMSDHRLRELLPQLAVVARALPHDKSRLVRIAQEENRVVGMTGDGINDAPALRRADIGFAMGSGAAVARDAGDILILDDNLASIVRAVLYGRTIFKSIRKFITLQLTMNFCAVGVSMIGPFIGVDAPVTVVQMLWINLIMDTLGGLAFAGEAPLSSYLEEAPKRRDEPILCRYMVNEILLLGGYTVALCLFFLKSPDICARFRLTDGDLCHLTAFFALFIFSSVFNCFNARSDRLRLFRGLGKNRPFLLIMGAVLLVQIAFVYLGGSVLRTMPLTASELGWTALLALTVLPAEEIRKWLWRCRGRSDKY